MKSKIIVVCVCIFISACVSHKKITGTVLLNQLSEDNQHNVMLLGKCTKEALRQAPFADWFLPAYSAYQVDSGTCNYIRPLLKSKQITIFMGTWCGDSRREVPRMLKMLECCNFSDEQLTLVMVSNRPDAYKQSPQHEEAGRNIKRVPTIIVEEKGQETGRIIEYPVVSLEKDLLKILRQENYMPNYSSLVAGTGQ